MVVPWAVGEFTQLTKAFSILLIQWPTQLKEATLSNDVTTGKPPPSLSQRVQKAQPAKSKEAQHLRKGGTSTQGAASTSNSNSARPLPTIAGDQQDILRVEAWEKMFDVINEALHITNMLVERVNPNLALQYYKLSETLKADTKKHGEFLSLNEGYLPGIAVHFNMQPKDDDFHFDGMSLFLGLVCILIFLHHTVRC